MGKFKIAFIQILNNMSIHLFFNYEFCIYLFISLACIKALIRLNNVYKKGIRDKLLVFEVRFWFPLIPHVDLMENFIVISFKMLRPAYTAIL